MVIMQKISYYLVYSEGFMEYGCVHVMPTLETKKLTKSHNKKKILTYLLRTAICFFQTCPMYSRKRRDLARDITEEVEITNRLRILPSRGTVLVIFLHDITCTLTCLCNVIAMYTDVYSCKLSMTIFRSVKICVK